ncbi:PREDICTED: zinc finger CCCH domain-containing protein 48-like [Populus euphratica]|uniref:Zinc finger CCCH domain-containing protein 48-like n=1 Tax=Populus euphratica TaxID=75702 RepID=A0AAJ6TMS0_POPEU|nr:PREDICTED: zinc finger CCCH domain-containing protein 48-like [Populus euphratica]
MFSDKLALWMFWQFMGLINIGGVVGCVISEGPWVFVGLPNAVKAWNKQVYALFVGNYLFFAGAQFVCFGIRKQGH